MGNLIVISLILPVCFPVFDVISNVNYVSLMQNEEEKKGVFEIRGNGLGHISAGHNSCRSKQRVKNTTLLGAIFSTCHDEKYFIGNFIQRHISKDSTLKLKSDMEGVLWKWTNYWTGWQPRWFVLDDGVLVYYKSQEEVNQGCKGSLKITACEISVSQADPLRLDVTVPGEQHFYLRASTSQERQQWLVALGSAKACEGLTTKDNTSEPVYISVPEERDNLKSKRSELRLYCDLLMQQVHSVKDAATQAPPDIEKLDESTHLLTATCDTFISTLEECLRLAKAEFNYQLPHSLIDKALNGHSHDPSHSPAPISPSGRKSSRSSSRM